MERKSGRPDHYRVTYRKEGDNLYIESCDAGYLALNRYSKRVIGARVPGTAQEKALSELLDQFFSNSPDQIDMIFEQSGAMWEISADIDAPLMHVTAHTLSQSREAGVGNIPRHMLDGVESASMLITTSQDELMVDRFSANLLKYGSLDRGMNFDQWAIGNLVRIKSSALLRWCGQTHTTMRMLDYLRTADGPKPFVCMIIPLDLVGYTGFHLVFYFIRNEDFYELHHRSDFIEDYYINDNVGTAYLDVQHRRLLRSDIVFDAVFAENNLENQRILFESEALANAQKKQNVVFTELYFHTAGGEKPYSVVFIPFLSRDSLVMAVMAEKTSVLSAADKLMERLSPREKEVVQLVLEGKRNADIAAALAIAEGTVKKILSNAYDKLGIRSRVELVRMIYH